AKARLELRSGQMLTARRLAEEAFSGGYDVQQESSAMLRSIDAEEFNQHVRDTEKAYDSAMDAYKRKDYVTGKALGSNFDPHRLRQDKKRRLGEIMMSPEVQAAARPGPATSTPAPVAGTTTPPSTVVQTAATTPAAAPSQAADSFANQVKAMQD